MKRCKECGKIIWWWQSRVKVPRGDETFYLHLDERCLVGVCSRGRNAGRRG